MKRLVFAGLLAVCASAIALEVTMTDEEKATCKAEGGCALLTFKYIKGLVDQSYAAGVQTCMKKTGV